MNNENFDYKLFLDDYRRPIDCAQYMHTRIGTENPIYLQNDWIVAVNYQHFVRIVNKLGIPKFVSFDHDLADGHYHQNMQEGVINYDSTDFQNDAHKTGYHCAKWLIDKCIESGAPLPKYYVHSMNPVGTENITSLLKSYEKHSTDRHPITNELLETE